MSLRYIEGVNIQAAVLRPSKEYDMPASRSKPSVEESAKANHTGPVRNTMMGKVSKSADPDRGRRKSRYQRVWRHQELFTVIEPPTVTETEELFGGWLR
jgi:hypothetical protein